MPQWYVDLRVSDGTNREEDLEEPAPELTAEEEAEQRRLYEEEQEFPDDDEDAPVQ